MTETPTVSLAVRAKRLSALARAKSDDEKDSQDQGQVETALRKMDAELESLDGAFALRSQLRKAGVPVGEDPNLASSARRLRDQVATVGRPTAQFLAARYRDIASAKAMMVEQDAQVWHAWSAQQIGALPLSLVPRLGFGRLETERRINDLKKLSARPPKRADIAGFVISIGIVEEELGKVEGSDIDTVLARFANGRIRLADLTDHELTLLRGDIGLANQLYVHLA